MPGYDRIAIRPGVLAGKPCIRGTRIGVDLVVHLVAFGWTVEQIVDAYPELAREDVDQALHYAADLADGLPAGPVSIDVAVFQLQAGSPWAFGDEPDLDLTGILRVCL